MLLMSRMSRVSPTSRKRVFAFCLSALIAPAFSTAMAAPPATPPVVPPPAAAADPKQLIGTWRVDLRSVPGATPYYQSFVITSVQDGSLRGKFYSTEIKDGRINKDWGPVYFAFTTRDGTGAYHSSGRLINGRLEGTTNAVGRGFLSVWTAERVPESQISRQSAPPEQQPR
jgi:hypothetical protein